MSDEQKPDLDAAFEPMATDMEYQREALELAAVPAQEATTPTEEPLSPGWLQRTANRVRAEVTELERTEDALRAVREERDRAKEGLKEWHRRHDEQWVETGQLRKELQAERESRKQAEDALRDVLEILKKKVPGLYVESRQIAIALLEEALSKPVQEPTGDGE